MSSLGQHTLGPGQQALFGQRLLLLGGRAVPFHLRNIGHLGDGLFNLQTAHKDISNLQYCSSAMHCSAHICSCQTDVYNTLTVHRANLMPITST